jgi:hypothetical protein
VGQFWGATTRASCGNGWATMGSITLCSRFHLGCGFLVICRGLGGTWGDGITGKGPLKKVYTALEQSRTLCVAKNMLFSNLVFVISFMKSYYTKIAKNKNSVWVKKSARQRNPN